MDYLIYFFIFFILLILVICGLPFKRTYYKNELYDFSEESNNIENFKTSSENDIKQGASTFYDWGLRDSNDVPEECDIEPPLKSKSKSCSGGKCLGEKNTFVQNDYYIYPGEKKQEQTNCANCNAYQCKNIDRYVLKSSVPPCPDMSEYALKSMVKPCPDLKDYVLKSQIPPCPERPDLSKYVLKSQIPACPNPVVCPVCPVCPPAYKRITDDPRFKNWLIRFEDEVEEKINKLYIRKTDCNRKVDDSFKKGVEEGKNDAYRIIAQGAGPDVLKKCLIQGGRNQGNTPSGPSRGNAPSGPSRGNAPSGPSRGNAPSGPSRGNAPSGPSRGNAPSEPSRGNDPSGPSRGNDPSGPSRGNDPSGPSRGNAPSGPSRDRDENRLADQERRLEFERNNRREEDLSRNKSSKINTTSGDDEFIIGWDPTSLGFGSIHYQMRKPEIK